MVWELERLRILKEWVFLWWEPLTRRCSLKSVIYLRDWTFAGLAMLRRHLDGSYPMRLVYKKLLVKIPRLSHEYSLAFCESSNSCFVGPKPVNIPPFFDLACILHCRMPFPPQGISLWARPLYNSSKLPKLQAQAFHLSSKYKEPLNTRHVMSFSAQYNILWP